MNKLSERQFIDLLSRSIVLHRNEGLQAVYLYIKNNTMFTKKELKIVDDTLKAEYERQVVLNDDSDSEDYLIVKKFSDTITDADKETDAYKLADSIRYWDAHIWEDHLHCCRGYWG
jgi:hypothetical protein